MFKVICIETNFRNKINGKIPPDYPKEGETCTVLSVNVNGNYHLKEHPVNEFGVVYFNHKKFIPLSEIDETELLEQRENQLQTL